jgi:hypothetical protein
MARSKRLIIALASLLSLAGVQAGAQEAACGSEAEIARDRAQRLEAAAASCRSDLSKDFDYCHVVVSWKGNIRLSAERAASLAKALRVFASAMQRFDSELAESRGQFDVHRSDQTVVMPSTIKCQKVGTQLGGDRVTACKVACYNQYFVPVLDCWRGGIDEMGACLIDNVGGLRVCASGCAEPSRITPGTR